MDGIGKSVILGGINEPHMTLVLPPEVRLMDKLAERAVQD